jgi:hypothetical protein
MLLIGKPSAVTSAATHTSPHATAWARTHATANGGRGSRQLHALLLCAFLHAFVLFCADLRLFFRGLRRTHLDAMLSAFLLGHQLAAVCLLLRGRSGWLCSQSQPEGKRQCTG